MFSKLKGLAYGYGRVLTFALVVVVLSVATRFDLFASENVMQVPDEGLTDLNSVVWGPGEDDGAVVLDYPDMLRLVPGDGGTINVFVADPDAIQQLIEAGAITSFGIFNPDGSMQALYLGTYRVRGRQVVFVANSEVPPIALVFGETGFPVWIWPLMLVVLASLSVYAWLNRKLTVLFYNDPYKQPVKKKFKKNSLLEPPIFERAGLKIEGWYLNVVFSNNKKWDVEKDQVKKTTKLYAKWARDDE